jgi:uncharacterized phiE125 gp8 family phage protein
MAEPLTLEEAKRHLRVAVDDDDAEIESFIVAARQMLEQRLQRAIVVRTVDVMEYGFYDGMPLPVVPFLGSLSITYTDPDGIGQTLAPEAYEIDITSEPVRVYALTGTTWPATRFSRGAVKLQYQAGYADGTVPAPLVQWMKLAVGTMYEHRESLVAGVSVAPLPDEFMKWLYQPYMVYK